MITRIKLSDNPNENFQVLEEFAKDNAIAIFKTCLITDEIKNMFHTSLMENKATLKMTYAISMAFRLSSSILEGIFNQPTPHYAMHYNRVNSLLDDVALKITTIIQNNGYDAMPIPASQIIDKSSQKGYLNHKLIAKEAGVGFIGKNNLLVTKEFGAQVRLVTILTNLPLLQCEKLNINCGNCKKCSLVCPVGAIHDSYETFELSKCVEQISKFQKIMFVAKGICGICVKACDGKNFKNI